MERQRSGMGGRTERIRDCWFMNVNTAIEAVCAIGDQYLCRALAFDGKDFD